MDWTKEEFLRADKRTRQKYLANKNKKQLQKICKAYGITVHGGAFTMAHVLVNLK